MTEESAASASTRGKVRIMNREIETNRKGKHHRNMSERYELDQRAIVNELSVTPSTKALE